MCGRFTMRSSPQAIAEAFGLPEVPELPPRYNIAPSQDAPAVRLKRDGKGRELALLRWGLIPFWADDPSTGYKMINARAETVATKPAFRRAFASRRCLLVADGFYEWKKLVGRKQPYFIRLKDDRPFGFAGLWERWGEGEDEIQSCTIIVTGANDLVRPIHDRMPVIISPDAYALWLDPDVEDRQALEKLLRPFPSEQMLAYPVSPLVNNPRNNMEQCVERAE